MERNRPYLDYDHRGDKYPMETQSILLIVTGIVMMASAICAATPTSPLGSKLATVYKVIEALALVVGKAKDTGLLPATAAEKANAAEPTSDRETHNPFR